MARSRRAVFETASLARWRIVAAKLLAYDSGTAAGLLAGAIDVSTTSFDPLAKLAKEHRDTPMAGRSNLQQAIPITFGYKAAVWLSPLITMRERLGQLRPRVGDAGLRVDVLCAVLPGLRADLVAPGEHRRLAAHRGPVRFVLTAPNSTMLANLAMDFGSIHSAEYAAQLLAQGRGVPANFATRGNLSERFDRQVKKTPNAGMLPAASPTSGIDDTAAKIPS